MPLEAARVPPTVSVGGRAAAGGGEYALSDAEWLSLLPLLPTNRRRGHPFKEHRPVIDAILWVLASGAGWRDLPGRLGPWQTAYDRFSRWQKNGTWGRVTDELLRHADEAGDADRMQLWRGVSDPPDHTGRGRNRSVP